MSFDTCSSWYWFSFGLESRFNLAMWNISSKSVEVFPYLTDKPVLQDRETDWKTNEIYFMWHGQLNTAQRSECQVSRSRANGTAQLSRCSMYVCNGRFCPAVICWSMTWYGQKTWACTTARFKTASVLTSSTCLSTRYVYRYRVVVVNVINRNFAHL